MGSAMSEGSSGLLSIPLIYRNMHDNNISPFNKILRLLIGRLKHIPRYLSNAQSSQTYGNLILAHFRVSLLIIYS